MDKKAPSGNPSASRPNPLPGCPMAAAFAAVGGKWKLTLIYWLAHGESHFAGLRRRGAPITPKVLAEQLRELGVDVTESQANFLWIRLRDLSGDELANALRKQGVIVAPGGPLGEDHHIRAAIRNEAASTRLLRAIENLL